MSVPDREDTADGPEQQGRERERDGDDERLAQGIEGQASKLEAWMMV